MSNCLHCGSSVGKSQGEFCCVGCNVAYNIINKLNLGKYYDYCKNVYGRSPTKVIEIENDVDYLEYIESSADYHSCNRIVLALSGVQCGACVWLVENTLKKEDAIKVARVNLSTNRLIIEWIGDIHLINTFVHSIEKLGYKVTPFIPDQALMEAASRQKDILKRLTVAGAASVQVMMLSFSIWAGNMQQSMGEYTRLFFHLFIAAITIPVVIYSGTPFFKSAIIALKSGRSNMDVPISAGVIFTVLVSIQETVANRDYTYYDAAISLIFVLLIGRYLDIRIKNQANSAAQDLILAQPTSVTIVEGDKYKLINIKKAIPGQLAVVMPGEIIPVDGVIIDGESAVDNSIISGESAPIKVDINSTVLAGSINILNVIKIKVMKSGGDTTLNEIIRLIDNAKRIKSRYINIADIVSSFYTPVVFSLALLTFIYWYIWLKIPLSQALLFGISVLIVTCPCALGLAVPVVQVIATMKLMKGGILLKSGDALERFDSITDIIFDKTGTITFGKPVWVNKSDFDDQLIQIISSVAANSKHPLMKAVYDVNSGFSLLASDIKEEKGRGIAAKIGNDEIRIGNRQWCGIKDFIATDNFSEVWIDYVGKRYRMIFKDEIRPEVKGLVEILNKMGYRVHILSGDRVEVVREIANFLGIDNFIGGSDPKSKYDTVIKMQQEGRKILMVGDGLNDSAVLQVADVSMSPSTALAIASSNADIVYQKDLSSILKCLNISKKSIKLVRQNFILSFVYNIITVPVAIFGLMTPLVAALAMAFSSITVIVNAMRLNLDKFEQERY